MSEYITIDTATGTLGQKNIHEKHDPSWGPVDNLLYFQQTVEDKVRGWFFVYDHALFHMIMRDLQQDVQGDVCEIGVAFGRSAIAVSNYRRQGDTMYLFDHFKEEERQEAENNITKYGTYTDVDWRLGDTTVLTPDTLDIKPIRFLHIDGSHEHGAVYKDLCNFSTKMADGGVIVMDDYNDQEYPGVNSGTLQFLFENPDWVLFVIGQNKGYLCQRKHYDKYVNGVLIQMESYNKFGLQFAPRLRGVNDLNVLLCCSREGKPFEEVRNTINVPVVLA